MRPSTATAPHPDRRVARRAARLVGVLTALALVVVLPACGVRLETAPPAEPVPDAAELVRRTAANDALGVAELAQSAQSAQGLPADVDAELAQVAAAAHAHADALGGPYDSGLDTDEPSLAPEGGAQESAEPATPAEVVGALVDAAGRNRTAATTAADGPIARLLGSIGASQSVGATRLAALVGVPGPEHTTPVVPEPASADESPSPSPSPSEPGDVATTAPGAEDTVPPEGLTAADYRGLILAEDGARYALEVRAALASDEARERLLARSRAHGERAQAWAVLASVSGTDQDPRRVAYSIPRADDDATLVRTIEQGLATNYASVIGTTAPSTRGVLVDLLVESALTLDAWGAAPVPFPGMPELA
ncbi:DUF4439 domain-containing protein [Xylanimonas ulmi]|uniref:Uncharacterized protein DUF4439 n=1 Tax=Xylanimonas ulmi TaxID=228973 RepID=A0A4Q7M2A0_9MICO|nr:DUF4439 domain-containing protein [Xylanibacterium ulmi]RZS61381.1 uncharacterized protein DUF4439 [Xylanibacterium ulmi]